MPQEFELAIEQICEEKGISKEKVIKAIEAALASAYKKDYGKKGQNVRAEFDLKIGKTKIFDIKEVVEEVEKPPREITLEEAKKTKKDAKVGDVLETEVTPKEVHFGRIAAQTAKQVITQHIREAEREAIISTFKEKEGEVIAGVIQRIEKGTVFVNLGPASGILFTSEQIPHESLRVGQRIKIYISEVKMGARGPEILASRAHPKMVEKLFELEVPEIAAGTVKIKSVAREAGARTKIAVFTDQKDIDPIGACIGQRGTRVQTVIAEIAGEKIDIIMWDEDPVKFIANALSPAKVISVRLDEKKKHALVEVAEDQLSLAIGKGGQNVRLAVKLTGWKIDVVPEKKEKPTPSKVEKPKKEKKPKEEAKKEEKVKEKPKEKVEKKEPKEKKVEEKKTKPKKREKPKKKAKPEKKAKSERETKTKKAK